jgi:hypothetical protein
VAAPEALLVRGDDPRPGPAARRVGGEAEATAAAPEVREAADRPQVGEARVGDGARREERQALAEQAAEREARLRGGDAVPPDAAERGRRAPAPSRRRASPGGPGGG